MAKLAEKYRPTKLDEVVGQPKAVAAVKFVISRGLGGEAVWISGPTGTGKTTLARIMAATIADEFHVQELTADTLTAAKVWDVHAGLQLCGMGKGGRVVIVNEADGLKTPAVRALNDALEAIPNHAAWIFTTTSEGLEAFEAGQMHAKPLIDRCAPVVLTAQGCARPFAQRAREIAIAEGLDGGKSEKDFAYLVEKTRNSMRDTLARIGAGAMVLS